MELTVKRINKTKAFIIGAGILVLALGLADLYSEASGGHSHGKDDSQSSEKDGHSH